jgi:hypothetical protein
MSARMSRCQNHPLALSAIEPAGNVFVLHYESPVSCTMQYRKRRHINACMMTLNNVATPLSDFISSTSTRVDVQIPIAP